MIGREQEIGFLGIGIMGEAMVRRLLDRGRRVHVWNLEPERLSTVVPFGAVPADSPRQVAEASDVVLACVLHTQAVERCVFASDGVVAAARRPRVLIDLSTTDPAATRTMAIRLFDETGTRWIDAPVSGGPAAARSGTLTIMAGGDPAAIAEVQPIFDDLAGTFTRVGETGAGQVMKIVNQAIVGAGYVVMAEALALAEAAGIDASLVPQALAGGAADSFLLRRLYLQMQARDFDPPRAYARQLLKDLIAVAEFAHDAGVQLPMVETALQRYEEYVQPGNEMADSASIVGLYDAPRRLTGSRHEER